MKNIPAVISARSGDAALEVFAFDGVYQIPNRDAVGYYFDVRLKPDGEKSRLAVLFSGTVLAVKPEAFGLPDLGQREPTFIQFSLAAIGDFLDEGIVPDFTPSGTSAFTIECFSPHFQSWVDRDPATDKAILLYLQSHARWAWKFSHHTFDIGMSDALRLRQGIPRFDKNIRLYEKDLWNVVERNVSHIVLESTPRLIKSTGIKPEPEPPNVAPVREDTVEPATYVYVDETRIADLKKIETSTFDFSKLHAICEELNVCYRSQCYHAVAALTRALIDHVAPVFGFKTFSEVANNYAGSRSFKESMQRLDAAARKIADGHLHTPIRASEVLPTRTQVNFSNEVDVLLSEIVRLFKTPPAREGVVTSG